MTDQDQPNPSIDALKQIMSALSMTQIRFAIARLENKTDKAAAEEIGISPATVKSWDNKALVDEAVTLMRVDSALVALEIRKRNLARAMAVKVAGLESEDEKIRQNVATEIVEWELGKAQQKTDVTSGGEKITREESPDEIAQKVAALMALAERRKNGDG